MTLTLDASDFGVWNYISLKNKTIEKHAIPLACEGKWDGKSGINYQEIKGDENNWLSILNAHEARGGLRGRGS